MISPNWLLRIFSILEPYPSSTKSRGRKLECSLSLRLEIRNPAAVTTYPCFQVQGGFFFCQCQGEQNERFSRCVNIRLMHGHSLATKLAHHIPLLFIRDSERSCARQPLAITEKEVPFPPANATVVPRSQTVTSQEQFLRFFHKMD